VGMGVDIMDEKCVLHFSYGIIDEGHLLSSQIFLCPGIQMDLCCPRKLIPAEQTREICRSIDS
jgi:hypothetical protein